MQRRLAGALLLVSLLACAPRPTDPRQIAVAYVGGEALSLSELEIYFHANLLDADDEVTEPERAEVKSRLFDAFVEERLLLAEAEHREVRIDDRELAIYLGPVEEEPEAGATQPEQLEEEARRRLKIEKLLESALRDLPPLEDADVRAHLAQHRKRLAPSRRLELRALMLDSLARAEKVYKDIKRRRVTFTEAVVAHERTPGQGLPMRLDWEGLSEEVRAALENLKPGQVSRPVEVNGSVYLFQLESWLGDGEEADEELLRRARQELEGLRRDEAHEALVREIRGRLPVRLKRRNLPFRYVESGSGTRPLSRLEWKSIEPGLPCQGRRSDRCDSPPWVS